ncbi:MAG: carbohydrate kinase [Bacteroidales bacterium]|nr:carbohydrate kinase [Bacteroidales bacterium]
MQKVIGIGETIYDIVFKNGVPTKGVPGGSVFNAMITLGRLGVQPYFISEVGNDAVGKSIMEFMKENGLDTKSVDMFSDGQTALSLAFLNENNDAQYTFYTNYPDTRLNVVWPRIDPDDLFLLGSFYALNPDIRPKIVEFLEYARERESIIYYDPNFRKSHAEKAIQMMPSLLENFEYADIVRGSSEDFFYLFKESDAEKIYRNRISFYCPIFIYTAAADGVELFTPQGHRHYESKKITPVSTIGAGDNFNAGVIYGIIKEGVKRNDLKTLPLESWDKIIAYALDFSARVCMSYDNYISC